jgi:hypothetical protein
VRPADNVVFDIVGERRQYAADVIGAFEGEVLVHLLVHLLRRQ